MYLLRLLKGDHGGKAFLLLLVAALIAVPILSGLPADHPYHLSTYTVTLLGKYLTYALLAVAVDLVWGYLGILSLGHGAFFALGGYAMGMYLMRQIGDRGVYGDPILPDFMVFLNWPELPWFWYGFDQFWFAALMVMLAPGLLAFVFGWLAFRSRVTGVYLIDHHPGLDLCPDARVLPQRNGLRRQQRPDRLQGHARLQPAGGQHPHRLVHRLGHRPAARLSGLPGDRRPRAWDGWRSPSAMPRTAPVSSATRSNTSRLAIFTFSAVLAGVAGALYVPQVGIINPASLRR